MAEAVAVVGVVASIASIVAEGIKATNALNTYIEGVKNAEEDMKCIVNEIKEITVVLNQIEDNMKLEQQSPGLLILPQPLDHQFTDLT